tara:strand:- start:254 stop:613 length:360 start_codon:yes stop_codon:yes gene_type:complete
MKNYLLVILLFSLTISCDESKNVQEKYSKIFYESEILSFPVDKKTSFWHYSCQFTDKDSGEFLSFINEYDNSIKLYSILNGDVDNIESIQFLKEGENGIGTLDNNSSHYFINKDSILYL